MVINAEKILLSRSLIFKKGSILQLSPTFPRFSPMFPQFCRTFSKFQGKKNILRGKEKKSRGKELGKYWTKSCRFPILSSQKFVSEKKKWICFGNCSVICDFQMRWESHNSQQLFLSSNLGVKWKGGLCENILRFIWGWGHFNLLCWLARIVCQLVLWWFRSLDFVSVESMPDLLREEKYPQES